MRTKLISYDLNATGQRYDQVIKYIESFRDWAKPLRSQYFVKTDLTDSEIVSGLMANGAGQNDSILVMDVTKGAWDGSFHEDVEEWMRTEL